MCMVAAPLEITAPLLNHRSRGSAMQSRNPPIGQSGPGTAWVSLAATVLTNLRLSTSVGNAKVSTLILPILEMCTCLRPDEDDMPGKASTSYAIGEDELHV